MEIAAKEICFEIIERSIEEMLAHLVDHSHYKALVMDCGKGSRNHLLAPEEVAEICAGVVGAGVAITL
jgi:hypothetical protein